MKSIILYVLLIIGQCLAQLEYFSPVQILRPSKSYESLELDPDVLARLVSAKPDGMAQPSVCVVGVVGPYHSGKSFLLNALASRPTGFRVGADIASETSGVWLMRTDMRLEGSKCELWFMDTEGFFVPGKPELYDAKLFAVAALLSDVLLINTVKNIDQHYVGLVEMLTKRVSLFATRSSSLPSEDGSVGSAGSAGSASLEDLSAFAQHGLSKQTAWPTTRWVVEDFVHGSKVPLEKQLSDYVAASGGSPAGVEYLTKLLGSIKVNPLFLPSTLASSLEDLSKSPIAMWTPEYSAGISRLRKAVLDDLASRKASTSLPSLMRRIHFIANSFSKQMFPEIPSLWEAWRAQVLDTSVRDSLSPFESQLAALAGKSETPVVEFLQKSMKLHEQAEKLFSHLVEDFVGSDSKEVISNDFSNLSKQIFDALYGMYRTEVQGLLRHNIREGVARFQSSGKELAGRFPIEPTLLTSQLDYLLTKEASAYAALVAQYDSSQHVKELSSVKSTGGKHIFAQSMARSVVDDPSVLLSTLETELMNLRQLFLHSNEAAILDLVRKAVGGATGNVGGQLVLPKEGMSAVLMSANDLEAYTASVVSTALASYDGVCSDREWMRGNEHFKAHRALLASETEKLVSAYKKSYEARVKQVLDMYLTQATERYKDGKMKVELSVLPSDEITIENSHLKLVKDNEDFFGSKVLQLSGYSSYKPIGAQLQAVYRTELDKLRRKNIELWRVHSEEAIVCALQRNFEYVQANCPHGWFCLFKLVPQYHERVARANLEACIDGAPGVRAKMPVSLRSSVFDSWYSKDLAREASEVKNNMYMAVAGISLPMIWVVFLRLSAHASAIMDSLRSSSGPMPAHVIQHTSSGSSGSGSAHSGGSAGGINGDWQSPSSPKRHGGLGLSESGMRQRNPGALSPRGT